MKAVEINKVLKTLLSMKYYYFLDFKTITLINEKYEIFCEQITVLKDEKKLFIFYKIIIGINIKACACTIKEL